MVATSDNHLSLENHPGIQAIINACYWYNPDIKLSRSNHKRFLNRIAFELEKNNFSVKLESSVDYPLMSTLNSIINSSNNSSNNLSNNSSTVTSSESTIGPICTSCRSVKLRHGRLDLFATYKGTGQRIRQKTWQRTNNKLNTLCVEFDQGPHLRYKSFIKMFLSDSKLCFGIYTGTINQPKLSVDIITEMNKDYFKENLSRLFEVKKMLRLNNFNHDDTKTFFLINVATKRYKIIKI